MLMKFINHHKNFASCEFSVFVAIKRIFAKICALMIKSVKAALKKLLQGKNAEFIAHFSKQGLSKG